MPAVTKDRITPPLDEHAVVQVDAVTFNAQAVTPLGAHTLLLDDLHTWRTRQEEERY